MKMVSLEWPFNQIQEISCVPNTPNTMENCTQLIEAEFNIMIDMDDEHVCNVVSMSSLNIHDVNDMQSYKLGDAMFDEDDNFTPQVLMR